MKHQILCLISTASLFIPVPAAAEPATSATAPTRAYKIDSIKEFTAGKLADAYFDDLVLENSRMRAIIARPDKPEMGQVRGGSLVDVISKGHPVDYFAALNTTADAATTAAVVVYTQADAGSPAAKNSTATVTLRGYVGEYGKPAPESSISVQTRYSLPADSSTIRVDSQFENQTTRTAWIQPADIIDWGEAKVFTESSGYAPTTAPVSFILGAVDNFSLGYYTSGTKAMEGSHGARDSIVLSTGRIADLATIIQRRKLLAGRDDSALPAQYRGMGATTQPGPGLVVLPGTETRYALSGGVPAPQPLYVPKEFVKVIDGKTTVSATRKADDIFTSSTDVANRIKLEPGERYTFTRYMVLSDENWEPIAEQAYAEKAIPAARLTGVVLEKETDKPIANARVQISGGPGYNGKSTPPPILQVATGPDGSFSAKLPAGTYKLRQLAMGRFPSESLPEISLKAGVDAPLAVLHMSAISTLRIAISEAETPTSSPLPTKLTIIAKPPFDEVNYGFTPDVTQGERNTVYMPQGYAVLPLTPGRYRLVASRGIEYDIFQKDITMNPGQQLTVSAPLPHVMKDLLPGMVSVDAGLVTTASAVGFASAESRAIQAACEGVSVIVSGDYGEATDLQSAINKLGLQRWVKAIPGRRELLHKDNMSADLFVYPLDKKTDAAFDQAIAKAKDLPPDVALADLRKQFPDLIFEISRPIHPEAGYLNSFPFDENKRVFLDDNIPPPDFNALQLVEGSKLGNEPENYNRYMAIQLARLAPGGVAKGAPVSPVGSSFSRLPFGQEVGYPRVYLYLKQRKTLDQITAGDVATAIRGQHFLVTNGPILLFDALDRSDNEFRITPGEIVDSHTTEVVVIRAHVLAAPWVTLQGINTRENGRRGITVFNIKPNKEVLRYPTNNSGSHIYTRYLKHDCVIDAYAYSTIEPLSPVVPDDLTDFGGPVLPFSWSGPIFVDRDGDGKIIINDAQP